MQQLSSTCLNPSAMNSQMPACVTQLGANMGHRSVLLNGMTVSKVPVYPNLHASLCAALTHLRRSRMQRNALCEKCCKWPPQRLCRSCGFGRAWGTGLHRSNSAVVRC